MIYLQILMFFLLLAAIRSESITQLTNDPQVLVYRRLIKEQNQKRIREFNSRRTGQVLWANPDFIHYTEQELSQVFGNRQIRANVVNGVHFDRQLRSKPRQKASELLKDYSEAYVNNSLETGIVKHQGKCGGCYSFAACNLINHNQKSAGLKLASEMEIIECSSENVGCDGGWPHLALRYVRMNGVHTDRKYKYRATSYYNGTNQQCAFQMNPQMQENKEIRIGRSVVKARGSNSIIGLISIINVHKVAAIAIYASNFLFVNHKSGIVSNCGQGKTDHAMTLVGYIIDHSSSPPIYAWIVKNSWGVRWGENGYVRMSMDNQGCGDLQYVSYLATM